MSDPPPTNDSEKSSTGRYWEPVRNPVPLSPAPHAPANPAVQGCAIASVSMLTLAALPFLGVALLVLAFTSGSSEILLMAPLALGIIVFAIYKIAALNRTRHKGVPAANRNPEPPNPTLQKLARLYASLNETNRARHSQLCSSAGQVRALAINVDDPETRAQLGPGLDKLQWLHLKGLLAHEHLSSLTPGDLHEDLEARISGLREALASSPTEGARQSTAATLAMTEERFRNMQTRRNRLAEISSDLERIETQLDLSLERAALHSTAPGASLQLHLAERMVETSDLFGSSLPMVSELDARFLAPVQE